MSLLKRVNPAASLFFKMFLWFWLAIFLVFVSSIWLVKQLDSEVKYRPLNPQQQKELAVVTRIVQKQADKLSGLESLESMLYQAGKRSRVGLVLYNSKDKTVIFDNPKRMQASKNVSELFEPRHRSLAIWVGGLAYWGASNIEIAGKEYQLFIVT
ncbi:MAG: two-component sensor histidine kinase, partial [Paraglaciecola sp.]